MSEAYVRWIEAYRARWRWTRGLCSSATSEMIVAFPELKRVRGFVGTADGGSHQHWWCTTVDGEIVDPTADQFENIVSYEPFDESKAASLPTGKCMACGGLLYYGAQFCAADCARVFLREEMGVTAEWDLETQVDMMAESGGFNPPPGDPDRPMYFDE